MRIGDERYSSIATYSHADNNLAKIRAPILAVPICYYYCLGVLIFINPMKRYACRVVMYLIKRDGKLTNQMGAYDSDVSQQVD